jgi:ppGpp synthetase/RelA/SpoT-type nucleotidyltranferase
MEFERPKYSFADVDKAGRILASGADMDSAEGAWAVEVLNNWRAAHNWPLRTVTEAVRLYATSVTPKAIVPYRIKRLPTIIDKLQRLTGGVSLSQMQDIGGCRAIVDTVKDVERIVALCRENISGHKLGWEKPYIDEPKKDGYRSHHLIVRFQSDEPVYAEDDGLLTEIQIRSRLQHAWATTVETVDVFQQTAIKTGRGPEGWRELFRLMSAVFALKENTSVVSGVPRNLDDLTAKIKALCLRHKTENFLESCRMTITSHDRKVEKPYYQLIIFDAKHIQTWTLSYERHEAELAFSKLAKVEKEASGRDQYVVLVSIESLNALREAYPNYWIDVGPFLKELTDLTGWWPNQDDVKIIP